MVAMAVFRCTDWDETLRRLTTTRGTSSSSDQSANIPRALFSRGTASASSVRWPGVHILQGAIARRLAGKLYPRALVLGMGGPTVWAALTGGALGTVSAPVLSYVAGSTHVCATLVVGGFVVGWFMLVNGWLRSVCCYVEQVTAASELPPREFLQGDEVNTVGIRLGGESVEIIKERFQTFTKHTPLVAGNKYISLGILKPWTAEEDYELHKLVHEQDNDAGIDSGEDSMDWQALAVKYERCIQAPQARTASDLRWRWDCTRVVSQQHILPLTSSQQQLLHKILDEDRRSKAYLGAGGEETPANSTLVDAEHFAKVEWRHRAALLEAGLSTSGASHQNPKHSLDADNEDNLRAGVDLYDRWLRQVEGPTRQILLDQLYTHFCREHESGVRTERRSLGRMVHHDHTDGAISEGEFMCFHLKEPHHLKEDHIEAVLWLPSVEQRLLIRKLLAAAVRDNFVQDSDPDTPIKRHIVGRRLAALSDRVVDKIMYNFDQLLAQILAPGVSISLGGQDDEEWLLKKSTDGQTWFYVEKNSDRMDWNKPWLGKTRYHQLLELISNGGKLDTHEAQDHAYHAQSSGTSCHAPPPSERLDLIVREAMWMVQADTAFSLRMGLGMWMLTSILMGLLFELFPACGAAIFVFALYFLQSTLLPWHGPLKWLVHFAVTSV